MGEFTSSTFGRKITIGKVKSITDPYRMGRVLTEKDNWLFPMGITSRLYPHGECSGEFWVPPVGSEIIIVDGKYYLGTVA
jgi:hypothetical protein